MIVRRHYPGPSAKFTKKDGRIHNGRNKGSQNKIPKSLKEAIHTAIDMLGFDNEGKEGVVGYFMRIGQHHPELMVRLVEKILPMQVTGANGGPIQLVSIPPHILAQMKTVELQLLMTILDKMSGTVIEADAIPGDGAAYAKAIGYNGSGKVEEALH